jgi:tetratricopeptide (TPR) repeat protein
MNLYRCIAILALTGIAGPAFAYTYCSPSDPNYTECTQQEYWRQYEEDRRRKAAEEEEQKAKAAELDRQRQRDEEYAEEQRRSAPERAEQARQQTENDAAIKALRARLLASPPLPPDRNPLLGRWRVATGAKPRAGDDLSQLMGMLANPGAAMCEVVFGGGATEFKPESWAANDSAGDDSLGPIQYRMQDKQVFALPDQGLPLLGFVIVDKNNIREFRLPDCTLVRVGAQPTAVPATQSAEPAAGAATPVAPARSAREPIEPVSRLGRGVQLHGEKDFQQALQQLLVAAQSDPNDPRVYVYLADTYHWLGMDAESNKAARRAKQLDPNAFEILR